MPLSLSAQVSRSLGLIVKSVDVSGLTALDQSLSCRCYVAGYCRHSHRRPKLRQAAEFSNSLVVLLGYMAQLV